MKPYGDINLGQQCDCHYLNQCWVIVKGVPWHLPVSNFRERPHDINLLEECESFTFLMAMYDAKRFRLFNAKFPHLVRKVCQTLFVLRLLHGKPNVTTISTEGGRRKVRLGNKCCRFLSTHRHKRKVTWTLQLKSLHSSRILNVT